MYLVRSGSVSVWAVWLLVLARGVLAITWPWESGDDDSDDDRNGYQPYQTSCPSHDIFRRAENISVLEQAYIRGRIERTNEHLISFLENRAQLSDFNASEFINNYAPEHNISIGLAFSGGGYRAMLNGAGQILGLDDRYEESNNRALGGLLQSSTYLTGLSGGSWLVGTLALNDWISVDDILSGRSEIWDLSDSIFNPNGINVFKTAQYYYQVQSAVGAKEDAGFPTSVTDLWGRMLSYQFMPDKGGENVTWSSIVNLESFKNFSMPFPIVVANGRNPGTRIINLNSTVYEFSPFEVGSWDPSVASFVDVKYTGTYLDNGKPNNSDSCVVNFDNAGFIMGTSSSLFNSFLTRLDDFKVPNLIKRIINSTLSGFEDGENDIAVYKPNPFYNIDHDTEEIITSNRSLYLVDGSSDDQNVPFYPLIQSKRDVDVILAFDNSGDTSQEWPNGSAIIHTYRRQFTKQGKGSPIPYVPETYDNFVKDGLNSRPVFFGCNTSSFDALLDFHENDDINATDIPLIIYLPNHEISSQVNTSSFKLSYDMDERDALIKNGFEVSSRNNLSDDRQWPTCIGCAVILRQQQRFNLKQSADCQRCFDKYCWEPDPQQLEEVFSTLSGSESVSSLRSSESVSSARSSETSAAAETTSEPSRSGSRAEDLTITTSSTSGTASPENTSGSSSSSEDSVAVYKASWLMLLVFTVVGHLMA